MFVTLFLFGVIASLFGPIKYGILPDHLKRKSSPPATRWSKARPSWRSCSARSSAALPPRKEHIRPYFGAMIMIFALLCWGSSLLIPRTGQGAPHLRVDPNIARSTGALLKDLWADSRMWWGSLTTSWFWLVGAVALSLMPPLVKNVLGANRRGRHRLSGDLLRRHRGRLAARRMARARPHRAVSRRWSGAFLLAVFALDLGFTVYGAPAGVQARPWRRRSHPGAGIHVAIDLAGLAIAGGLFIVPAFAAVQSWAGPDKRARVIAAVNVLNAAFIVVGTLALAALQSFGLTLPMLFLLIGVLNFIVLIVVARTMPANGLRDFLTTMLRAMYRMEVKGAENFENAGPNPIVALNHVSFLDAAVALSLMDKEPVFAIDYNIAQRWWVKPFLKLTRAMPLDPSKPMATRTLINAVKAGEPLVIFPEGRITVTGSADEGL